MAYFDFNGKNIYYEEYGEGRPLILLNGIMMSTLSWTEFIEPFSKDNRLLLLDFLDQGKSDRMTEDYPQEIQVDLLKAFFDHIKLDKCTIMGISYGGEVALAFAVKYPEYVDRLILFDTTARTGPWLGNIGLGWNRATMDPECYYYSTIPIIYSPEFYRERNDWMNARHEILKPVFANKDFTDRMIRLTNSAEHYDVLDRIHEIQAPTLVVSADQDYLIPAPEQRLIVERIPNSKHVVIQHSGHASMYEQPLLFAALTLGFCNVSKVEYPIK